MSMASLGRRISEMRRAKGIKQIDLAARIGYTQAHLSRIERGERHPTLDLLNKIAAALDVPVSQLLDTGEPLRLEGEVEGPYTIRDVVWLPVVSEVRAGYPAEVIERTEDREPIDAALVRGGDYFWVRVQGDSMKGAGIDSGDLVLIRRQPTVELGQIAVVDIDGEGATIKRVHVLGNDVLLVSENPEYQARTLPSEKVRIVGRVKKIVKDV